MTFQTSWRILSVRKKRDQRDKEAIRLEAKSSRVMEAGSRKERKKYTSPEPVGSISIVDDAIQTPVRGRRERVSLHGLPLRLGQVLTGPASYSTMVNILCWSGSHRVPVPPQGSPYSRHGQVSFRVFLHCPVWLRTSSKQS
jgi:hypothetical protein